MSALHKLKAYFGMVPADEVDGYEDDGVYRDRYAADSEDHGGYDAPGDRIGGRRRIGGLRGYEPEDEPDDYGSEPTRSRRQWSAETPVRGAWAVDSPR